MSQLQDRITSAACSAFWARLSSDVNTPSTNDWRRAEQQGRDAAIQLIRTNTAADFFVEDIGELEDDLSKRLWLDIPKLVTDPEIAQPISQSTISEVRIGVIALLGSILGGLFFGAAARIFLDMRDAGILFGGPLVAYFLVWQSVHLAQNQGRRPEETESLYAKVWRFILLSKSRKTFSRLDGEHIVQNYWEIWSLELITKIKLWINEKRGSSLQSQYRFPDEILLTLNGLSTASDGGLRTAVSQTLMVFRNYGVDIPENCEELDKGPLSLRTWDVSMKQEYDVFDDVSQGDRVIVLREPIKVHGKVQLKGLVRKHYETIL